MKKTIIVIAFAMFLMSCGGSTETKPVEATYGPVGVDSSNVLPPLTDSAKADTAIVDGNVILKPVE